MAATGPIDRAALKRRFESVTALDLFWVRDFCNQLLNDPRKVTGQELLDLVNHLEPEARRLFINALYDRYPHNFHQGCPA